MAENQIKEERISDDESEEAAQEEQVFCDAPIKIEYPLDKVEPKEEPRPEGPKPDSEYILPDYGHEDDTEVNQRGNNYETNNVGCTSYEDLRNSEHNIKKGGEIQECRRLKNLKAGTSKTKLSSLLVDQPRLPSKNDKVNEFRENPRVFSKKIELSPIKKSSEKVSETSSVENESDSTSPNCDKLEDQRMTLGERLFECTYCDAKFSRKATLSIHVRIHTREKPYACSVCDETFSQKGSLSTHLRRHTGEKPFACSQCDAKFPSASRLRRHILKHTGERPHTCPHCHEKFSQSCHLAIHIRKHTGEKPYACSQCNAKYIDSSGLRRHIIKHFKEKRYARS